MGNWCSDLEYKRFKNWLIAEANGNPICYFCKRPINLRLTKTSRESFTIEHLKPKGQYPELTKTISNLVAAHKSCNSAKGTKTAEKALADIRRARRGTRPEWQPTNGGK